MTHLATPTAYSAELAAAARAVRARHLAAGSPHLPILDSFWIDLTATLRTAESFGDDVGALAAIQAYRVNSIEAIDEVSR